MLTCYILDDEQMAVDALTAMLRKKFSQKVTVIGSTFKVAVALEEIEQLQPDILFLDVEMPDMDGLQFLKQFPDRRFHLIFTTAHEKYALPALKASATDYLVKPLSPQDVFDALQKCETQKNNSFLAAAHSAPQEKAVPAKISLAVANEFLLVNVDDIIRVEASSNYSHFYFTNRNRVIVSKTLKEFEEQLIGHNFFRVHQSHLVNLQYVESIKSDDGDFALLRNGYRVEISRRKKALFLQKLKIR